MIQTSQICTINLNKIMMNTAINLLSVTPMRKEPAHRSEMVSQLLFGEYVEILEEQENFVRVKCLYDEYEGWVQANQLTQVGEVLNTNKYISSWIEEISINGRNRNIPMCSPVYSTDHGKIQFGQMEINYFMDDDSFWNSSEKKMTKSSLKEVYNKFIDTPYLWGGKSVFGIDCSGFVQQVFKMFGVKLLRDAYLQAEQGSVVASLEESKLGDLAFFQNENGRVIHVGIILENNQIVHASGKVRMDTVDEKGIVNNETGKRTHQLHSIRRYF
jgi:gamma-D-glutamyl-L-lysine dipeptidyl-peptidase